jgi:hypothetical protein
MLRQGIHVSGAVSPILGLSWEHRSPSSAEGRDRPRSLRLARRPLPLAAQHNTQRRGTSAKWALPGGRIRNREPRAPRRGSKRAWLPRAVLVSSATGGIKTSSGACSAASSTRRSTPSTPRSYRRVQLRWGREFAAQQMRTGFARAGFRRQHPATRGADSLFLLLLTLLVRGCPS